MRRRAVFRLRGLRPRARKAEAPERGLKRAHFTEVRLPYLLLLPQLGILLVFFFVPSIRALVQAFQLADPWGMSVQWVGFENFDRLLADPAYRKSAGLTVWFTLWQNAITLVLAAVLAFATNHILRGQGTYKTLILLPYAIAPAIAGVLWAFMFNPAVGPVAHVLHAIGIPWDPTLRPSHAMWLVIMAASWKHLCFDYIFLLAGMLMVPQSLLEAAAMDGAGPIRRYFSVVLPMLTPTLFFLIAINLIYGLFETFAIIDAVTEGGPAAATTILVYKVYQDGFLSLDLGSSAAQSVILMICALVFTMIQFRFIERRVNYDV